MIVQANCFPFEEIPRFSCPRCEKGQLRILKDTIVKKHPAWITTLPNIEKSNHNETGKGIKLHARIEEFGKQNEDTSKFLLAIKWIGNDGSHESDLSVKDVVIAYELFEKCLIDLYEESSVNKLKELAGKINTKKKPLSKIIG